MNYEFKDKYYDYNGADINEVTSKVKRFISKYGYGEADGSRSAPAMSKNFKFDLYQNINVFGNGYHKLNSITDYGTSTYVQPNITIIGTDWDKTIIQGNIRERRAYVGGPLNIYIKDATTNNLFFKWDSYTLQSTKINLKNCCIDGSFYQYSGYTGSINPSFERCLFKNTLFVANQSSYKGITCDIGKNNLCIYDECYIDITESSTNLSNLYIAFNNCKFRIGNELNHTSLTGSTAEELKTDFVNRCNKENITCPITTEGEESSAMYRWIFTNNSTDGNGTPFRNSEIHLFEKKKGIILGWKDERLEELPITTKENMHSFFSSEYASAGLSFDQSGIAFDASVDITKPQNFIITSKIIPFRSFQKINRLKICDSFPISYGTITDSTGNIDYTPISQLDGIVEGKNYIVRSTNDEEATIIYDEKTYSSSILSNNFNFKGVADKVSFTPSNNAVVYEITDHILYSTLKMRIVNQIPPQDPKTPIKSGELIADYWYLVETINSENQENSHIKYKNKLYKSGDSFLVTKDNLTFEVSGNAYLRRCWNKDFNFDTEKVDKEFWKFQQMPKWFDVVMDDPRCLMKGNTNLSKEIQTDDDGHYIASGHPLFYKKAIALNGTAVPTYNIQGAYMQLQVEIRTLEPTM